ncbi:MAG TPA: conjugal transfer protein TraF [Anaeromyxobacteraceae bacterium]|nr:conjugal transfer protein TraF [Anaeromyxobacteraceae bacterium]
MPIALGSSAPPLALVDLHGRAAAAAVAGEPALLFFYKDGCAASEVAAGVVPRFAAVPGLRVLAVSQDGPEETRAFAAAHGWGGVAVMRDPEPWPASDALGVRATPTWILLDAGGRVAASAEGWSRADANALAREAARLAGAAPLEVAADGGPEPAFRPG